MSKLAKTEILSALESAKRYLPKQGGLVGFVHHNTLHDFEEMPFHEAARHVGKVMGSKAYASLEFFKTALSSGRIQKKDMFAASSLELNADITKLAQTYRLQATALLSDLIFLEDRNDNATSVRWKIRNGFLGPDSNEAWTTAKALCLEAKLAGVQVERSEFAFQLTHANDLSYLYFCQLFDLGFSHWSICFDKTILSTFLGGIIKPNAAIPKIIRPMNFDAAFMEQVNEDTQAIEAIMICLDFLEISEDELADFFLWALKDIGGFSGLALAHDLKNNSGKEFLDLVAIRLLILIGCGARAINLGQANRIIDVNHGPCLKTSTVFQAIQVLESSKKLQKVDEAVLIGALTKLESADRFEILQEAYEKKYYRDVCSVLQQKEITNKPAKENNIDTSFYSAIFCIDEREESLRRHLEEVDSTVSTYGYAGFFNIDMLFQAAGSHEQFALCPVSITPNKVIREDYKNNGYFSKTTNIFTQSIRKFIHQKSRTLIFGTLFHIWVAFFTAFADLIRLGSPKIYSKVTRGIWRLLEQSASTGINFDEALDSVSSFSVEDYADRIVTMLKTCGLQKKWTSLIYVVGHGSSSLNNPHAAAYNCGACSGNRGGPNARVFALAANHPLVREKIKEMGVNIPNSAHFVGGYHDTCSDDFIYYDLEQLPSNFRARHNKNAKNIQSACERDAQERSRRFESIPECSPRQAFAKVQYRALKYAQPRPECGHATNALCIVGDRAHSKHIFLDRRAFLCSYDNDSDVAGEYLAKLLSAVLPVCAGINLEYYFSYVDNEKYGSGTKLPHNVTGLAGVMNGSLSDLQTGLPWQMVEIHEPVRLLMMIYAPLDKVLALKKKIPYVFDLIDRGWVNAVFKDPRGGAFVNIKNEPVDMNLASGKSFASSCDVYRGKREHIDAVMLARSFS